MCLNNNVIIIQDGNKNHPFHKCSTVFSCTAGADSCAPYFCLWHCVTLQHPKLDASGSHTRLLIITAEGGAHSLPSDCRAVSLCQTSGWQPLSTRNVAGATCGSANTLDVLCNIKLLTSPTCYFLNVVTRKVNLEGGSPCISVGRNAGLLTPSSHSTSQVVLTGVSILIELWVLPAFKKKGYFYLKVGSQFPSKLKPRPLVQPQSGFLWLCSHTYPHHSSRCPRSHPHARWSSSLLCPCNAVPSLPAHMVPYLEAQLECCPLPSPLPTFKRMNLHVMTLSRPLCWYLWLRSPTSRHSSKHHL